VLTGVGADFFLVIVLDLVLFMMGLDDLEEDAALRGFRAGVPIAGWNGWMERNKAEIAKCNSKSAIARASVWL
jgi:hypothetical protein